MHVLVCGDRNWSDLKKIEERLSKLSKDTLVIEGGAKGADLLARRVAEKLGFDIIEIPANWVRHGRAAGPIRNQLMLGLAPDLVIAFHPDLTKSKGTADTVNEARRRGIPVEIIS